MWRHPPVRSVKVGAALREALPPELWDAVANYINPFEAVMLRALPMLRRALECVAASIDPDQLRTVAILQQNKALYVWAASNRYSYAAGWETRLTECLGWNILRMAIRPTRGCVFREETFLQLSAYCPWKGSGDGCNDALDPRNVRDARLVGAMMRGEWKRVHKLITREPRLAAGNLAFGSYGKEPTIKLKGVRFLKTKHARDMYTVSELAGQQWFAKRDPAVRHRCSRFEAWAPISLRYPGQETYTESLKSATSRRVIKTILRIWGTPRIFDEFNADILLSELVSDSLPMEASAEERNAEFDSFKRCLKTLRIHPDTHDDRERVRADDDLVRDPRWFNLLTEFHPDWAAFYLSVSGTRPLWETSGGDLGALRKALEWVQKSGGCDTLLRTIKKFPSLLDELAPRLVLLEDATPRDAYDALKYLPEDLRWELSTLRALKKMLGPYVCKYAARRLDKPAVLWAEYSIGEALVLLLSAEQKKEVYRQCAFKDKTRKKYVRRLCGLKRR